MEQQLALLDDLDDHGHDGAGGDGVGAGGWRIDDETRRVGREGVARARAALAQAGARAA